VSEPNSGGLVDLALTVARLSETVANQAQQIANLQSGMRALADQMAQLDEDPDADRAPTTYLSGKPK
jgi:uncharacterized coiled-coil protein SlyX